ncbi:transaldolase family protein, partial [Helicobacter suis]
MKDCYLWCDFIERSFLEDQFLTLVEKRHVFGATSNPVLFAKALSKPAYRGDIAKLKSTKSTAKDI